MKPQEIAITPKGKSGMSGKDNDAVLVVLRKARAQGVLPAMSFEYNKHPRVFGSDPLYLLPKGADLKRTGVKVRSVIRQAFGDKYSVRLG